MDQVSGLATPRSRLKQLLPDPGCRRTRRDVAMDQLTALVADAEEDIEDLVVNGVDHQEVVPYLLLVAWFHGGWWLALPQVAAFASSLTRGS